MCAWPIAASSCACVPLRARRARRGSPGRPSSQKRSSPSRSRPAEARVDALAPRARAASRSRSRGARRPGRSARARSGAARTARPARRTCRCRRARSRSSIAPALGVLGEQRIGLLAVAAVEPLRRARPSSQSAASLARVPEQIDARARPRLGHRRRAPGTSTSPRAARSARRAAPAGSRAPAPPPARCGRPPGDEQLVHWARIARMRSRRRSDVCSRRSRV